VQGIAAPVPQLDLLIQAQNYLTQREEGLPADRDLEAAWRIFYDLFSRKIRKFAFTCGATEGNIADCVQEVWTELLVRLPAFRLDPGRGKFDTWLFHIVRGKTVDLLRSHKRRLLQEDANHLQTLAANCPSPGQALEDKELVTLARHQLSQRLSGCNFQVLQLRLMEDRPVAEVAEQLGLTHEQVWYRFHRARREVEQIGMALKAGAAPNNSPNGKVEKIQESAQGKPPSSVSRTINPSSHAPQGGFCVDYVFQRLELGRRELTPEWKVEWNCDGVPTPILFIRKTAIVAYAEICGPGDFINTQWPRLVNAAIAAGVAAGIATIITTPTAALPIFQTEFHKHLQTKGLGIADERIQLALSARQEANGPWSACKG
jgi:RNA polymerase sigma factor (sigma-70 family)